MRLMMKAGGSQAGIARRASYRVQLNRDFTFVQAAEIAGYLAVLGISHLYCSPYLQAAPGSTHGYDVADPERPNDELGGQPGLSLLSGALREHGLGQILDIVPNHMAADPKANLWWRDVLENGPSSQYAGFFDIDWEGGESRSAFTVLVPILGDHYGRVIERGEVRLARSGGDFVLRYHEHELPVSPKTVDEIVGRAARRAGSPELAEVEAGFAGLPPARVTDREAVAHRHERKETLVARVVELCRDDPGLADALDEEVEVVNRDPDRLDELLRRQNYRLAYWRTASEELDYRRFFNIETLVGLRAEDEHVFEKTHRLVLQLVDDGTVDGLRVDHVDGLRDPEGYLERLDGATSGTYTVVEKILAREELLVDSWPVAGTTGYDFLIRVNNLFVATANERPMTDAYGSFTGQTATFADVAHESKIEIMRRDLAPEVGRLTSLLSGVCETHRRHRDHTRRELRDALSEVVAHMCVYRTYNSAGTPAGGSDRRWVEDAVDGAVACREDIDLELLRFIGELAQGHHAGEGADEFVPRFQQLTAPVMAKGVEDTAFYRYNRLVSLNEVGGDPGTFGLPADEFHTATQRTAHRSPESMLTLATHDTKRGADVRARINVLSEVPEQWAGAVASWARVTARYRGRHGPDPNSEYLLYQTIVGAWPIEPDRLTGYMSKALREARVHTSWADPDEAYERDVEVFVRGILGDPDFLSLLGSFLRDNRVVERGRRNSLAQAALLLTCPGIPDIYQGTELWDMSLVDPDNRRPVDYASRAHLLSRAGGEDGFDIGDDALGRSKLQLIRQLLAHRSSNPDPYSKSGYEPLPVDGEGIVAFERDSLVVIVPCRSAVAGPLSVELPAGQWTDVVTGAAVSGGLQPVASLLSRLPVAVLERAG